MSKVYAVCEPVKIVDGVERRAADLTPALEYGEIVILCPHAQSMLATVPTVRMLKEKLKDFSDDDYILPVGDPVLMSTVAMIAGEANNGRVKYLKWEKKYSRYSVIEVDSSGKAI